MLYAVSQRNYCGSIHEPRPEKESNTSVQKLKTGQRASLQVIFSFFCLSSLERNKKQDELGFSSLAGRKRWFYLVYFCVKTPQKTTIYTQSQASHLDACLHIKRTQQPGPGVSFYPDLPLFYLCFQPVKTPIRIYTIIHITYVCMPVCNFGFVWVFFTFLLTHKVNVSAESEMKAWIRKENPESDLKCSAELRGTAQLANNPLWVYSRM